MRLPEADLVACLPVCRYSAMGCTSLISEPSRHGTVYLHLLIRRSMGSECLVMLSCNWFLIYNLLLAEAESRKAWIL